MDNYPVFNPTFGQHYFGGESVQQTLLARAFRDIGYDVSMIVMDYGQPKDEVIEGIRVLRAYDPTAGIPVLRFFHPRASSIVAAMKKADADVYYHSCAGMITGLVAQFCRANDRKFVFRIAHDTDCIPGEQLINLWRDRKIYEYGLKNADLIAAQGVNQQVLLRDNYALDSEVINMTVELPPEGPEARIGRDILWINNLRQFKRPDLAIEVARKLPDFSMAMIGGKVVGFESLYEQAASDAESVPNLDFRGAVSYHDIGDCFSSSRVFLNTSDSEGFPNSFLQAWVRGLPVISFFDPDGLIQKKGLGLVPSCLDDMCSGLQRLLQNPADIEEISARARRFAIENYSPTAVANIYNDHLQRQACKDD